MRILLSSIAVVTLTASLCCAQSAPASGQQAAAPRRTLFSPAALDETAPAVFKARFTTTQGDFVVEIDRSWAPRGADRFYNLVKNGFFDNASFFRVLPGFIVQFGVHANPRVSAVWSNATIKDDPAKHSNLKGTITFATAGPSTRTTQLFVNLADNPDLDSMGFAPLGNVVQGMEVIMQLYGGYGEGAPEGQGPDQNRIQREGKPYLDKLFPKLDSIKTATIVTDAAPSSPTNH
jgi:peptidyl-prolyl cis-trans isomerase A (cyclophilin A)